MIKTAVLFPGQGAQYPGMGKKLYASSATVRAVYEEASDGLGMDLQKICFEGSDEELQQTALTQPAILATSVAYFRCYVGQEGLPWPQYLAGHSLGEYTALCCAGAIPLRQAVRLVHQRGQFMQEAVQAGAGAMAAINKLPAQKVKEICSQYDASSLGIAAYNLNGQVVISGLAAEVEKAIDDCITAGAEVVRLKVSAPFHMPLMRPAAEQLREVLHSCTIAPLRCPVIANVTGRPYASEKEITESLYQQMIQPVQWVRSLEYLRQQGVQYFLDAGPRKLHRNQVNSHGLQATAYALEDAIDLEACRNEVRTHISAFATPLSTAMAITVCTPNHNTSNAGYESGVIAPFQKMKQLQETLEQAYRLPLAAEISDTLADLLQVLRYKQTSPEELQHYHQHYCFETGALLACPALKDMQL